MRSAVRTFLLALPFTGLLTACLGDPDPDGKEGLDLVLAVAAFPDSVLHWSGRRSALDPTRLLLSFQASQDSQAVAGKLAGTGLEHEPDPVGTPGKRILHTETEIWIRSVDRKPLARASLESAGKAFGRDLAWVGALYRVPMSPDSIYSAMDSLGRLYCPHPHWLRVSWVPPYGDSTWREEVESRLKPYSLKIASGSGIGDVRWSGAPEGNVYRLSEALPALEPAMVAGATLAGLPMLSPTD